MQFSWQAIRRTALLTTMLVLLGAITGCGGKGKVTGTVTGPDGQPLPLGRITFLPASGPPGVSADIEDGKYTVEDVATGENKVSVETAYIEEQYKGAAQAGNSQKSFATAGTGGGGPPPKDMAPEVVQGLAKFKKGGEEGIRIAKEKMAKYRPIPEKFTDPKTSGLSVTVKSGNNDYPVDLSK
jgi:hypothetical protein